jgi:hypothetical protein
MPRKAHIDAPGARHLVICRGIERRKVFWSYSGLLIERRGTYRGHPVFMCFD